MIRLLRYLRISNTMFEVKVISSSLNFIFISPSYFLTTLLMLFNPVPCIASDFFDDAMRLFLTATIFLTEFLSCIDRYLFLDESRKIYKSVLCILCRFNCVFKQIVKQSSYVGFTHKAKISTSNVNIHLHSELVTEGFVPVND